MPQYLKLNQEIAEDIKARVKTLDFKTLEKLRKAKEENGTFDVIVSTEALDRAGEIVRQDGWDLSNYKNNPIVLWGHDYYSLPIGICTDTYNTTYRGMPALGARGVFLSADINPFAQQVRRMYEYGVKSGFNVGCTTSVGFIPKEFDPNNQSIITRAELLEFSFVPVPAQAGVGPAAGRALTFDEARALGIDFEAVKTKGISFTETIGYVPDNVTSEKAAPSTAWSKPALNDFTEKTWEELSEADKKHIAEHFAYAKEFPPQSFDDLKLPHHEPVSGKAVWSGVKAAMGALMGDRGGVEVEGDRKAVYEHLAAHYREFGKEAPEFKTLKEAQAGDQCTTDDGSPGVLTTDPKDPDGPLVCLPQSEDKAASRASQKQLLKALGEEHERHTGEIEKAFEDLSEKAAADEDPEKKGANRGAALREALKDLRDTVRDEHAMHRAETIACFRSFDPAQDKAFDKKKHLKALRGTHDEYESKCNKCIDDFEERCMKSVQGEGGTVEEHIEAATARLEGEQKAHKKAVTKTAKGMCKAAFGEEEQADEKTIEILKEYLAPHIDAQILPAIASKIGSRISAATKEKLREAHEHLKAATAVVEALHGGLGDGDGEEGRSDDDTKSSATVPEKKRSRPTGAATADTELEAHMFAREVLREITTTATSGLERIKREMKERK